MTAVKKELRAVNDKSLCTEISTFVDETLVSFALRWDSESERESLIDLIDEFFDIKEEEGVIDQYKVLCDKRNNTAKDMQSGLYHLDIHFRQFQCLNVTKFLYTINTNPKDSKLAMANPDFFC